MLKKCFSTVACMDMSCDELIKHCLQFKMDGIEIRLDDNGGVCGVTAPPALNELGKRFREQGIEIVALGSSACFLGYQETVLDRAKQAVDRAAKVQARAIRVFLGNFAARTDAVIHPVDYEGIVAALREVCDDAKSKGVEIWIETHNEFSTGKVLKSLLSDINRDNLKIIWDIMHPIEAGESVKETWELIGDRIAHVHMKDGYDRKDPEWNDYCYTRLGEGDLPLHSILELLKNTNYERYVSLEWETAWRNELNIFPGELSWVLQEYADFFTHFEKNSD